MKKINFFRLKKAEKDFTPDMLPTTRRGVFKDVLKLHFWMFIKLGMLLLLFSAPIHLLAGIERIYVAYLHETIGTETAEAVARITYRTVFVSDLRAAVNIPLLMLFSVGFSGIMRVIRQYAWEENVGFRHDFALGVKQNFKQTLLLSFIVGLCSFICVFIANTSYTADNAAATYAVYIPMALGVLALPVAAFMTVCIPVYSNTFAQNLRVSLALYLKTFFRSWLAVLCAGAPFITFFIPDFYVCFFGRFAATVFAPFGMLGFYLYALRQLDKYVNAGRFDSLIGKGLYNASESDGRYDW